MQAAGKEHKHGIKEEHLQFPRRVAQSTKQVVTLLTEESMGRPTTERPNGCTKTTSTRYGTRSIYCANRVGRRGMRHAMEVSLTATCSLDAGGRGHTAGARTDNPLHQGRPTMIARIAQPACAWLALPRRHHPKKNVVSLWRRWTGGGHHQPPACGRMEIREGRPHTLWKKVEKRERIKETKTPSKRSFVTKKPL